MPIEILEERIAPAVLFHYVDVDGDDVTMKISKGHPSDLALTFDANGHQLEKVDLTNPVFKGADVSITGKHSPGNGGDGFVNVGYIDATGVDLGVVRIDGDLGRIDAGDGINNATALKELIVHSLGRLGASTQEAGGNLDSHIKGSLNVLRVQSDLAGMVRVALSEPLPLDEATTRAGVAGTDSAKIGPVTVGGSVRGGSILSSGGIGLVHIMGSMMAGTGENSGSIETGGNLAGIVVGGSLVGGNGSFSGSIGSGGDIGFVVIGGSVEGGDGYGSGAISGAGKMGSVTIKGSLIGGMGSGADFSGSISDIGGDLNSVKIGGNLEGGAATRAGGVFASGKLLHVAIDGSVISGTGLLSGAIQSAETIRTIVVQGSILGNADNPVIISAPGGALRAVRSDVAIGNVLVSGSVENAQVLAGYDSLLGTNADAQIGKIRVKGDWIASTIAAGTRPGADGLFGTNDDVKLAGSGIKDNPAILSRIGKIIIKGAVYGTVTSGDNYGFVAEQVNLLKVGDTLFPLEAGPHNDNFFVGLTDDIRVLEV